MWRSASKSAAATPRLATIVGQPERSRGILEAAVPLVQKQGVVNPLGPDHGRGQKEVELTVAVGVERGDGRTEAGADAADRPRAIPLKSDGLTHRSPAASLTCNGWAASKFSGTAFGSARAAGRGNGLITRRIFAHLAVRFRPIRPGPAKGPGDRD